MIDSFSFGTMVINGRQYTSDLFIFPDGRVQDNWWRSRGHALHRKDVQVLVDAGPDVIIAGTGINGLMKPEPSMGGNLEKKGINFMAGPNEQAVAWYNRQVGRTKVGACFHLSC